MKNCLWNQVCSSCDLHYNAPNVPEACQQNKYTLVTSQYGSYPHTDDGVEVRRIFHQLRHRAIENFELFKSIFDAHGQVPTKGLINSQRFALERFLSINWLCFVALSIVLTCELA